MIGNLLAKIVMAASVVVASPSFANTHQGKNQQSAAMTAGEVRKVDKDARKITIKHEPLENLDMPAMTMVFQVKDPAILDQVKAGDKVKFRAEKLGGAFTVIRMEQANETANPRFRIR